eukprot:TRINITY_DN75177_c0_g1_i1.p2 TRINITY_DN75177_c0_g1~~TRINITY_DN75177_c0_g1_i1.p2  ORF type:complete len:103 (+),score=18.28 TRINITY_DN75177_c0_g1_i1:78-386(+)
MADRVNMIAIALCLLLIQVSYLCCFEQSEAMQFEDIRVEEAVQGIAPAEFAADAACDASDEGTAGGDTANMLVLFTSGFVAKYVLTRSKARVCTAEVALPML